MQFLSISMNVHVINIFLLRASSTATNPNDDSATLGAKPTSDVWFLSSKNQQEQVVVSNTSYHDGS